MTNSIAKGKAGEREAAAALTAELGISARRGVQYQGGTDSPDVQHSLPGVHIEVKRTERFSIYDAVEQATEDGGGKVPVVMHRRNRGDWLIVVPLARLKELAVRIVNHINQQDNTPQ